ncbi:MAG TPA: 2,3-bisphosphoglycerate-independent phosphoglycerate mutase [Bacilli bacterium]|nr:2,3-bisphosphoglycerate-independent phosphoglycerate mutase [Bacilli bacterium]
MKKPVILCIMDGYGQRSETYGNCVAKAHKPNIDRFFATYPHTLIEASGEAVGLPEGQMGNSEVGHLNIGAGRIVYQSLTLINKAVKDGSICDNPAYKGAIEHAKKNHSKLHLIGLVSDGGVHSHVTHFLAAIRMAHKAGLDDVYVHALMDGRDVDPQLGASYIKQIVDLMDQLHFGKLASIGGRYYGMDRDKNMDRVDIHYRVMVDQDGPSFTDYRKYFNDQYAYLPTTGKDPSDEFLIPHFHLGVNGKIEDNDAIIFMNFRPDRAIQLATVFTNPTYYQNPPLKKDGTPMYKAYVPNHQLKNIHLVQTMKYADSVKGPIAFELPLLTNTFGEYIASKGLTQLRIAETEKYAHVTFFFDGTVNYDGITRPELKGSRRVLVNSPKVATYDLKPEMSAYEVRDALIKELDKRDLDVVVINFANCDMVGHTAIEKAVVKAVETVDACVGSIIDWVETNGGTLLLTADHGNAEMILDANGRPFTAHTTSLVPFGINIPGAKLMSEGGKLSNIAPTMLELLGLPIPQEMDEPSLIIK